MPFKKEGQGKERRGKKEVSGGGIDGEPGEILGKNPDEKSPTNPYTFPVDGLAESLRLGGKRPGSGQAREQSSTPQTERGKEQSMYASPSGIYFPLAPRFSLHNFDGTYKKERRK